MSIGREVAVYDAPAAVAPREQVGGLIRPVASPAEVLAAQNDTRELVAKALRPGIDYGKVPGTDKSTLLKPGSERICAAFGCFPRYNILTAEVEHDREVQWTKRKKDWSGPRGQRSSRWVTESGTSCGLYRYVVECELIHRGSGTVIGQGIASCSSMESKYVDRPRDSENTVLKMAEKRAFVAATLNTFGLSDQFTQDIEENDDHDDSASDVADMASVDEIRALLKAPAITERERSKVNALIAAGLTVEKAQQTLAWLRQEIHARAVAAQQDQQAEAMGPTPDDVLARALEEPVRYAAQLNPHGADATDAQREKVQKLAAEIYGEGTEQHVAVVRATEQELLGKGQAGYLIGKLEAAQKAMHEAAGQGSLL